MDIKRQMMIERFAQKLPYASDEQIKEKIRGIFARFAQESGWSPVDVQVINHEVWVTRLDRPQSQFYLLNLYAQLVANPLFEIE